MKRRRALLSDPESSENEAAEQPPLVDVNGVRDAAATLREEGVAAEDLVCQLRLLARYPMTVADLAASGVAKAIKALRSHSDAAVARLASSLFTGWKKMAKAESNGGAPAAAADVAVASSGARAKRPKTKRSDAAARQRLREPVKKGQGERPEDPHIWRSCEGFQILHPPLVKPKQIWGWEEEQTFAEFVDIGKREPNAQGTGRFKLTPQRRRLGLLNLAKKTMSSDRLRRLNLFLKAFLGLDPVLSAATGLSVRASKKKASIIDRTAGVSFPLRVFRNGCVDVFSIFDVLVEYVAERDFNLLAVVEQPLGEMVSDEGEAVEISEVLGWACGDRVAVVQCYPGVRDIELFGTIAHELMHTMGFDHTTHWRCLMNPSCYDGEWLFLAPHNLKKLKLVLSQEGNASFVLDRYKRLLSVWWEAFIEEGDDEKKHHAWLEEKVALLEDGGARC